MIRRCHAILGVLLLCISVSAAAATTTISPGTGLQTAIHNANPGDTIQLNPGTYTWAGSPSVATTDTFTINKAVSIVGLGATPADVVLQGAAGGFGYVVWFASIAGGNASGASLSNVTLSGSFGGALLQDTFAPRLSDVTLRDVVISTSAGTNPGVFAKAADRVSLDNLTVDSGQGVSWEDVNDSLIMNSTIPRSTVGGASGLRLYTGARNTIVNNTIGSPKTGVTYSFTTTAVSLEHTVGNRFEGNTVQGFAVDGVNIFASNGANTVKPSDNYAAKNTVIATGFAESKPTGSTMWANCGADNTWFYANDAQGSPECGICVWTSRSNMLLGNVLHNQGISGTYVSGDAAASSAAFCPVPSFRVKPTSTFLQSNDIYFNKNDQIVVRTSDNTEISRNFLYPRNGLGGARQACVDPAYCQSAFALEADPSPAVTTSNGFRVFANTTLDNFRGIQSDDGRTTGLEFALNRVMGTLFSRYNLAAPLNIDHGSIVGGNHWSQHSVAGNPGATPYTGVYYNLFNSTGQIVDRFPYQSENLGRGAAVTVSEPRSGFSLAQGTRKTVRWNAPGCIFVDVALDGITDLATSVGNTGYRVVTIPDAAAVGTHNVVVRCKDSNGTVKGQGTSANFSVVASSLKLMAPGRDDVFNSSSSVWVAWKKTAGVTSVNVELSTDGGATFTTTFGPFTGTSARITLPAVASTAYAVIRLKNGTTVSDYTDGVFAIRGASGAGFKNITAGRIFVMGALERLEWASPQNSRVVSITAQVGANPVKTVATNLPDRGSFNWNVADLGGAGNLTLTITFKQSDGTTTIGSAATNSSGITRYATTITFGALSTLTVGGNQPVTATANSGLAVTFSSSTPGVCTMAGATVTGVANGTCTIVASQAGNATYAAAQVPASFLVSTNPPRLGNISTRGQVLTGDNVMIGGFIIGGSVAKSVLIRARGPSMIPAGVLNAMANPTLTLVNQATATIIGTNDNWGDASNAGAITATGKAPTNAFESAILTSLSPGAYTAVVSGVGGGTGVGIVEVFEIDQPAVPLTNISTRGRVLTGDDVMIGGFIIDGDGPQTVLIRARGPSMIPAGVTDALPNPQVVLVNQATAQIIATNDNWGDATNASSITATGLAPTNALESAILITLQPGAYTAVVSGVGGQTGVGIVEVFAQ